MRKVSINRREFVKISSFGTGVLSLGWALPGFAALAEVSEEDCECFQISPLLRIDKNGDITIFVARQEMGQGVNTSLPMILAEELEVDFQKIKTEVASFGSLEKGAHDTGGSQSVTSDYEALRKAGATAKAMLITAAAKRWNTKEELCKAENGAVTQVINNDSLTYSELICDAAELPIPTEVTLKNIQDFKIVGKEQRKRNLKDIITGKAKYGMDLIVPGMLYAVVERCPVMGGKLLELDDRAARALPGVIDVVSYEGTGAPMNVRAGVAVIATSTWTAMKARKLLKIKWNERRKNKDSTEKLFKNFKKHAGKKPKQIVYTLGDTSKVKTDKEHTLTAEYAAPFLAHATMEPINFIASVNGDKCELWGGLQLPDWAVSTIAETCNIPANNIKVNLALMGGGFGRRLQFDFAIEAVKIAQKVSAPVKVIWDRTDDIRFDNYRPANYHRLTAKWADDNTLQSWEHHVLTTPVAWSIEGRKANDPSEMLGGANRDFWYKVPNVRTVYTPLSFNIQRGWLRGVEPVVNVFALESFVDEVAQTMGKDPLAFRLSLLENRSDFEAKYSDTYSKTVEPDRLAAVLKLAAEKIGWDQPRKKNHFMGIAGHLFFCDSYAAHAIEIELLGHKKFRIVRIVAAIDCGVVINPDGLKSQMQGGTVFGLGQALRNEITVRNGRVEQDGFAAYDMARFSDVPPIEVHTIASEAKPGGVGEVGVPTVAPALCNALAAAGYRPRSLPIKKEGFEWGI